MFDPTVRLEDPADDDIIVSRFEASFSMPCFITRDQRRRLHKLFDEIISAPENTPRDGVHWLAGSGAKPNWSRADATMLGVPAAADAPASGEPTFDDQVLFFESCARGFVSEKEQKRSLRSRALHGAEVAMYKALRAVLRFWGSDPEAFGDKATVTSLAGRFAAVADQCLAAVDLADGVPLRPPAGGAE